MASSSGIVTLNNVWILFCSVNLCCFNDITRNRLKTRNIDDHHITDLLPADQNDQSQKPYHSFRASAVPYLERTPLKISCQIYPSTIPPIRFGMKKTVRKTFCSMHFFCQCHCKCKCYDVNDQKRCNREQYGIPE